MKRILDTCVLVGVLVLVLVAPAGAGTLDGLPAPAECASGTPEFHWLTGGTCNASFCQNDDQCWSNCPDAQSAACNGNVCQYTYYPGSGGGNNCNQSFCSTDAQCTCQDGTLRQCIGSVCV